MGVIVTATLRRQRCFMVMALCMGIGNGRVCVVRGEGELAKSLESSAGDWMASGLQEKEYAFIFLFPSFIFN